MNQTHYEGVEIDVCHSCSGVWLDTGEITTIVETKERSWPEAIINKVLSETGRTGVDTDERRRNLSCPKCDDELPAVNYQSNSGIIVNTCGAGHGIWLDAGELAKIQIFMEKWDLIAKDNSAKYQAILNDLEAEHNDRQEALIAEGPSASETINRFLNKVVQLIN